MERQAVHYNRPQLRAMAVQSQHMRAVWARGTGKSDGLIAPRIAFCVFGTGVPGSIYEHGMPRSMGGIIGRSFAQILTRTLPPVVRGLERIGYKINRDFVVREKPLRGWEHPLFAPLDWHNAIAFRNGAAASLISQQNPGSANGPSFDWGVGDEAKFLKKEQYDEEFVPAMRGNRDRFGHLSCHQSTCLVTDMPTSPNQRWILDSESEMDPHVIDLILATQFQISKRRRAIMGGTLTPASVRVYESEIRALELDLNALRIGTVYFTTASALDNIEVLGKGYLTRMKQILPDYLFRTSILNKRPDRVEGGFYPGLDDEKHTYHPGESKYVYQAGNELFTDKDLSDCRTDGDLVPGVRLEIGPDFGSSFNCLVIGQLFDSDFNVLNQLYVKHPKKIRDLAILFDTYYKHHTPKSVLIYYDHTMIGEDAVREYGFIEELRRELSALSWKVELRYIGQAAPHHEKYVFWGRMFAHSDSRLPRVRFNAINAEPTLLSMRLAGAKQVSDGFKKDKDDERNPNADQAETTHLSDACDVLVMGRMQSLSSTTSTRTDILF